MILPEELGSWRTQLQNAADQALTLIQRGRSCRKVELTDPYAARGGSGEERMNTPHNCVSTPTQTATRNQAFGPELARRTPKTEPRWVRLL